MIAVFGEGRGFRVVWLLEEMGLAHRPRPVDLLAGVENDAEFLAVNPAGFIPAILEFVPSTSSGPLYQELMDDPRSNKHLGASERGPSMDQYEHALTATKRLLCAVGESHWAKWVQDSIERWRATHDSHHHLSGYAGMGSFTDIVICRENRHTVTELQEPWANALLLWLQALCFFLAKQPQRSFAAERLFNAVGKLDAPLSAFEGGDRADASSRGSAEKPRLSGWRCRLCGYAQVSYRNTEAFIADDVLPDMIFHACEKLTLDLLVDRVLADEPADITGRREQMATALASSNISLHDCAGWMRPCPSCGSNETEVYYWRWATSREARFTPDY